MQVKAKKRQKRRLPGGKQQQKETLTLLSVFTVEDRGEKRQIETNVPILSRQENLSMTSNPGGGFQRLKLQKFRKTLHMSGVMGPIKKGESL